MNETPSQQPIKDTEEYRDHISTVDDKGKRVWIYPKKPSGRFYRWRTYLSWALLAFLFGAPFIKVNGEPLLLFNILERKFVIFGLVFAPQDFHLFVLAMITFIVFIVLFTVVFGRLFCGWVCPQTIFMEMVFRKIEYAIEGDWKAQQKLNAAPWTTEKIFKKVLKQGIFFAIAVLVANTFLAYIIGVEEVMRIASEPISQNLGGFIAMILFSFAFYFVFSYLREQVCVTICPYGRLQGVMLDQNSIVVAYDFVRGEPRGKMTKAKKAAFKELAGNPVTDIQQEVTAAGSQAGLHNPSVPAANQEFGDCIDCHLCVHVCPTGIDIRNGTQLECVNCTACIDACDSVMDKIGRPRGLIRYDSYKGIAESKKRLFNPRSIAYSALLVVLIGVNVALFGTRTEVEALIQRTPGMLYQKVDDTYISNLYNYQIINKTKAEIPIEFRLVNAEGRLKPVGQLPTTVPNDVVKGSFFVELDKNSLESQKNKLVIEVYSGDRLIDQVKTSFLGPIK